MTGADDAAPHKLLPLSCGFVGLGSQGGPIARKMIEAGYPMRLWARRMEALAPFAQIGATTAATVSELAGQIDYLGICVVDDAGVREICEQAMPKMRLGALVVIHSTVHPETSKAMAELANKHQLLFVDAPVSGGQPAAEAGTLTIMAGGSADALARAKPVLACFGGLIVHLGEAGAGQQAKLINNTLLAANMAMAHASLGAGERLGIDRAALASLINASSGQSYGCGILAHLPTLQAFAHGARLLVKDTGLLSELMGTDDDAQQLIRVAAPFLTKVLATT